MRGLYPRPERRVCRALGVSRSSLRYAAQPRSDEDALRAAIITLASQYGRYGYRLIAGLLRQAGWAVSHGRVARIWQQAGLKVPRKQPRRGRLWRAAGSCIRLRPTHRHHVWSWDFVMDRTDDGRLRAELLNGELFYSLREAQVLIERWRAHSNTVRPHGALGYRPPAPETDLSRPLPAALPRAAQARFAPGPEIGGCSGPGAARAGRATD